MDPPLYLAKTAIQRKTAHLARLSIHLWTLLAPYWCREQESNLRPTDYESVALPTELSRPRGANYRVPCRDEQCRQKKAFRHVAVMQEKLHIASGFCAGHEAHLRADAMRANKKCPTLIPPFRFVVEREGIEPPDTCA